MIFHSRTSSVESLVPSTVDNKSGWAWVFIFVSLSIVALSVIVRISVREKPYKADDAFNFLAHVVALVVWIFWAISLVYGLGRSFRVLDDNEISNTQLYFFLSYVFLNIPIALSKISFFLLVKRIFAQTESISGRVLGSTIGLITAWCIASSFVVLLSCSRATLLPNAGAEYCVDSTTGFRVIAALDWFLELIAMALPIYGFYSTSNPWKYIKTLIWMVLVRVPNIVLSVMHILFYSKYMNERQSAIDIVPTFIWAINLLTYNLISATLPSLMKLTKIFGTQGVAVGNFDSEREAAGTNSKTNHSLANLDEYRTYPPSTFSRESEQHFISSRQRNP